MSISVRFAVRFRGKFFITEFAFVELFSCDMSLLVIGQVFRGWKIFITNLKCKSQVVKIKYKKYSKSMYLAHKINIIYIALQFTAVCFMRFLLMYTHCVFVFEGSITKSAFKHG